MDDEKRQEYRNRARNASKIDTGVIIGELLEISHKLDREKRELIEERAILREENAELLEKKTVLNQEKGALTQEKAALTLENEVLRATVEFLENQRAHENGDYDQPQNEVDQAADEDVPNPHFPGLNRGN